MINSDGAILPSFLRSTTTDNKPWRETQLTDYSIKTGVVVKAYAPSDDGNFSQSVWEYDVEVQTSRGAELMTPVVYKNCHMQSFFGGVADKFLWTPRLVVRSADGSGSQQDQPGSTVLVQCLRGITNFGIIIGGMQPEEAATEPDEFGDGNGNTQPTLLWEYNGVHIDINKDGELTLIRKGPTKNDGTLVTDNDEKAGATVIVDKDGNITAQTGDGKNSIVIDSADGKITATADQELDLVSTNGTMNLTSQGAMQIKSSTDAVTITGQQGVTITDGIGKITLANGTIQLKGAADELIALVASLVQLLLTATATTPMGPAPLDPGTLAQLPQIYAKLLVLSGG